MKIRTYLADNFGGINEALQNRSSIGAVIHGLDIQAGLRGASGRMERRNPFRGIACRSPRKAQYERHIGGPRDDAPTWRNGSTALANFAFKVPHPVPAGFF